MTININSGTTSLNQSLALLPGAKMNIAQGAVLSLKSAEPLKDDSGNPVHYTGSNNLIIYDRDQWLNAYKPKFNNGHLVGADPIEAKFVYTSPGGLKRLQPVAYSPSRAYTRTEADLVDAVVDINGRLITDGYIYTTVDVDLYEAFYNNNLVITGGGASVISSKGTGVLAMNNGAGHDFITLQPTQTSDTVEYAYIPMASARLQNADGSYVDTIGSADGASYEYCAACGEWYLTGTHKVDITWIVDGVPSTQEVCLGKKPVYGIGNDPVKEGYEFIGWSTANDNEPEFAATADLPEVTREVTYWACFKKETKAVLGDFDLDGDVDASDLTLLARHVGKIEVLTGQALENADVNGDGEVNANDLTKHARYIGKIITDWNQE